MQKEHPKLARELELAIADYVRRHQAKDLLQMCEAAEHWHKGDESRMRTFARNVGCLNKSSDYRALAAEARLALRELESDPSRSREIWEGPLAKLHHFAYQVDQLVKKLRSVARLTTELSQAGMGNRHVNAIVGHALEQGHEWRKSLRVEADQKDARR